MTVDDLCKQSIVMNSAQLQQRYAAGDRTFHRLDLSGLDLSGLDLQSADFSGSDLYGTKLINTCLHRARFSDRANLAYADLSGADLSGADLRSAILEGANLDQALTQGLLYDASTQFPAGFDPAAAGAITAQGYRPNSAQIALPSANFAMDADRQSAQLQPPIPPAYPQPRIQEEQVIETEQILPPPAVRPNVSIPPLSHVPTPYSFNAEEIANQELSKEIQAELLTPAPVLEPAARKRTNYSCLALLFGFCFVTGGFFAILSAGLMSLLGGQGSGNPFESLPYPRAACGDPLPSQAKDYPADLYPVYVTYSFNNLTQVKTKYCRDAFIVSRTETGRVIQVASFRSAQRAQQFASLMQKRVGSGFVGSRTQILQIK